MDVDPVALLEACYVQRESPAQWIQSMLGPISACFDDERLGALSFRLQPSGASEPQFLSRANSPREADFFSAALQEVFALPAGELARALGVVSTPGVYSLERTLGYVPQNRGTAECELRDAIAVVVHPVDSPPLFIATFSRRTGHLDVSVKRLWRRISVHLGAGLRLCGRPSHPEATDVDCVMDTGGAVVHASPSLSRPLRERLREATRAVDRARSRRGRSDPEAALDLWRGLFLGRWSLVDHFDSDGKRFVIAQRNAATPPGPRVLTKRQRQVLFYAAAAWSNKEIGYALGLAEATVATHLAAALQRMNLQSRAEWIRLSCQMELAWPEIGL